MNLQSIKQFFKSDWSKIKKTTSLLFIFIIIPKIARADVFQYSNPSKTMDIYTFVVGIIIDFISLIVVFYTIFNAFISWLFILFITMIIKYIYNANPTNKIKRSKYLFFAFIGYFIDKVSFFISYQTLGSYTSHTNLSIKTYWDYSFNNDYGEIGVTIISGLLIFLGMSILTYYLLSDKLYSEKKYRYILSIAMGILANPWWFRILFPNLINFPFE